VFAFCDVRKRKDSLAPELYWLESQVFAEDLAAISWDANWARRDKRISSGSAGAAGVACDITRR
jgi:hypothetical protein